VSKKTIGIWPHWADVRSPSPTLCCRVSRNSCYQNFQKYSEVGFLYNPMRNSDSMVQRLIYSSWHKNYPFLIGPLPASLNKLLIVNCLFIAKGRSNFINIFPTHQVIYFLSNSYHFLLIFIPVANH